MKRILKPLPVLLVEVRTSTLTITPLDLEELQMLHLIIILSSPNLTLSQRTIYSPLSGHSRQCQIPGCCCHKVREIMENRGYSSRGPGVSYHQQSSTDSDSDYGSENDRILRPSNLRLLKDDNSRNPKLHPQYHLKMNSYLQQVSTHHPIIDVLTLLINMTPALSFHTLPLALSTCLCLFLNNICHLQTQEAPWPDSATELAAQTRNVKHRRLS